MIEVNTKLLVHGALYLRDHKNGIDPLLAELIADEMEKIVADAKKREAASPFDYLKPSIYELNRATPPEFPGGTLIDKPSLGSKRAAHAKNRVAMKWARAQRKPFSLAAINARTSNPTVIYQWVTRGHASRAGVKLFTMSPVTV